MQSGKYGFSFGSSNSNDCTSCVPGKHTSATGSSSCLECPAGSACPGYSTSSYIPCPLGRYNSFAGATNCSACPQGKYGPYRGSAICLNCPKGKFGPRNGSVALDECEDCPAGKFSSVDGLYSCTLCSKTEYQPDKGQSSCHECPGVGEIGDAESTGCMTDPSIAKLHGSTFIEELFTKESRFTSLSLYQRYLSLSSSWSISRRLGSITLRSLPHCSYQIKETTQKILWAL